MIRNVLLDWSVTLADDLAAVLAGKNNALLGLARETLRDSDHHDKMVKAINRPSKFDIALPHSAQALGCPTGLADQADLVGVSWTDL